MILRLHDASERTELKVGQRNKPAVPRESAAEREIRDQEVLRATRELAAYFKGRRTEREARAALKIIKAFVRDRERRDPVTRAPLPGTRPANRPKQVANRKAGGEGGQRKRRKLRRKSQGPWSASGTEAMEPTASADPQPPTESDDRTSE